VKDEALRGVSVSPWLNRQRGQCGPLDVQASGWRNFVHPDQFKGSRWASNARRAKAGLES